MYRKALTSLIAAGLSVTFGQMALAADLSPPPPPFVQPLPYNWTGCYFGGNLGGARGNIEATDVTTGASISPNASGFAGGAQFGCDYQTGAWVVGFRNLIDGTNLRKSVTFSDPLFSGTVNSKVTWFDALTARGGFLAQPNLLLYVQGGAAWAGWDVTFDSPSGQQLGGISGTSRTGWTVGGGLEWQFVPQWSTFLEYNYTGFGTRSATFTTCSFGTCSNISAKANLQDVLIGVNYRF